MLMLNMILSFIFLTLNHPMSMGLILLLQTISIAIITGQLNSTFWFSYILFLIMIGGLLVLFIYMTTIASNEMFTFSKKMFMKMTLLLFIWSVSNFWLDSYFINILYQYKETIFMSTNFNLTKFFNYPSMLIIFLMIIYLFLTLIAIVKITKIEFGPLRQMH